MSDDLSKVGAVTLTADEAAMLRKVLAAIGRSGAIDYVHGQACIPSHLIQEARAIVALLPEPVDADLVEARRIAAEHALEDFHREAVLEGVSDDAPAVKSVLAAIRRGRALERDSREG